MKPRRVLIARELGDNSGQSVRLRAVAGALRAAGLEPVFALRDIAQARQWLTTDRYSCVPAPLWLPRMPQRPPSLSYAALLMEAGWVDADGLSALLAAWRTLLSSLKPDLLLADFSPTALLAARSMDIPVAAIGSSFELPPDGAQFAPFRWWDESAAGLDEAMLLECANTALTRFQGTPLDRLPQLFADVPRLMLGLPELSHYTQHLNAHDHLGPSFEANRGASAPWPGGKGKRVFVALRSQHRDFPALMQALQQQACRTLLVSPGLSPAQAAQLRGVSCSAPVALQAAVADADLVISHANHGIMTAALLAGKPQLVLPARMEQYMAGVRLEKAGLGLCAHPGAAPPDYARSIADLTTTSGFASAANSVAQTHAGHTPETGLQNIVTRCQSLISH